MTDATTDRVLEAAEGAVAAFIAGHPEYAIDAILAMHHLYHWQRICGWGAWNGDPNAVALRRASEADAGVHRCAIGAACRTLWHSAPVAAWFGAT